jgi:thymidylate synthase (FAD)
MIKSDVLDKGFIEVVDSLGNDLTVVNSARVSFGKRKEKWDKSDERLVRYLAKHKHYSPFRHLQVQFHMYNSLMKQVEMYYEKLIDVGVAKEQARIVLPLSQFTEVYWTASFQAVMNFIELRNEKTSQWEIQEYAKVLLEQMKEVFPKTTELWSQAHGWV